MRLHGIYIVMILLLGACTGAWQTYPAQTDGAVAANSSLGVGDVVTVHVLDEDSLSADYTISHIGEITMPLIGAVNVQGLSPKDTGELIEKSLIKGGFLINPEVIVSMTKNRMFAIMGEVMHAGEYEYKADMSILDAVAKAGGFSYRALQTKFDIVRKLPDGSETVMVGGLSTRIAPNDIIRVRERFF